MRPENVAKLQKIKTFSSILWQISGLFLAFLPFWVVAANVVILAGWDTSIRLLDISYPISGAPFRARVALAVMIDVFLAISIKRLYHLFKLFGNYASGEVLTVDSARQIRQMGITSVLFSGVYLLSVFVPPTLLPHSPDAIRTSLLIALHAAFVIAISWIMEMAAELREENELTV